MLNFDQPVVKRSWASRRRLFVVLGVAALVLVPTVGSTLAGSISINGNNSVEFGQGTVMTTGCDDSITITPTSTYDTISSEFVLADITVSGVDGMACAWVFFMIKMYDSAGAVVPLCASDDGLSVLLDPQFATDASSSCAALTSADSTGFVYTLDQLVAAESVNSLSIESSGTRKYSVGDTGPGGGTIFYVDLNRSVGSQYFEAACAGWQNNCDGTSPDPTAEWGCMGINFEAVGTAIGDGEQDTPDIANGCSAATLAGDYTNSGKSDWFLPSRDELNQMYVEMVSVGGSSTDGCWSSSEYEYDASLAWNQRFYFGYQGSYSKGASYCMRPVRSF